MDLLVMEVLCRTCREPNVDFKGIITMEKEDEKL